jgi:hypothetical protein
MVYSQIWLNFLQDNPYFWLNQKKKNLLKKCNGISWKKPKFFIGIDGVEV